MPSSVSASEMRSCQTSSEKKHVSQWVRKYDWHRKVPWVRGPSDGTQRRRGTRDRQGPLVKLMRLPLQLLLLLLQLPRLVEDVLLAEGIVG